MGINVEQARTSPFGQYLISQIQAKGQQHLQELASLTGFEPTRDLLEVLAASSAAPGEHSGLVAIRGNFDVALIKKAAADKGAKVEDYKGATLISGSKDGALALLDNIYALAGDAASVHAAIDQRASSVPTLDPATTVKVNELSINQDAWALTLIPPSQLGPKLPTEGPLSGVAALQKIDQASAGLKFGSAVAVSAEAVAQTAQDATALADVVRFLANMATLNTQQQHPELTAILQTLTVNAQANVVNLSLSIPEAQLEQTGQAAQEFEYRPASACGATVELYALSPGHR